MITGVNHITIAVSELSCAFDFYTRLLAMRPHARWRRGAYLTCGGLWICLSKDLSQPARDYSHIAFSVAPEHYRQTAKRLRSAGVIEWKQNSSEGDSLYFLDPDGQKLEIHSASLTDRLDSLRVAPYEDLVLFDTQNPVSPL